MYYYLLYVILYVTL